MKKDIIKALSLISQLGISMAVPIIGCIFFGKWLDAKLNTNILFLIIFTILGIGTAFRTLYIMVIKNFKD